MAELLRALGEDPTREGLEETPGRFVRALAELLSGREADPQELLRKRFAPSFDVDTMIVLRDIRFHSLCEHHLLPFGGSAHVAYLPGGTGSGLGVFGLSKLARVVEAFARRLQIQERMTHQIARAIEEAGADGVGVIVEASHLCMVCRGVRKEGASMVTSALLGKFRTEVAVRQEFLRLCAPSGSAGSI